MNDRIDFGCDFIMIMRSLAFKGSPNQVKPVNEALAQLFLVQWGLTPDEVAAADRLFYAKMNAGEMNAPLLNVAQRIAARVSNNPAAQQTLIVQMAALGAMDFMVTPEEGAFVTIFQRLLNIGPVDYQALCIQGGNLALALNNFGRAYIASF